MKKQLKKLMPTKSALERHTERHTAQHKNDYNSQMPTEKNHQAGQTIEPGGKA